MKSHRVFEARTRVLFDNTLHNNCYVNKLSALKLTAQAHTNYVPISCFRARLANEEKSDCQFIDFLSIA